MESLLTLHKAGDFRLSNTFLRAVFHKFSVQKKGGIRFLDQDMDIMLNSKGFFALDALTGLIIITLIITAGASATYASYTFNRENTTFVCSMFSIENRLSELQNADWTNLSSEKLSEHVTCSYARALTPYHTEQLKVTALIDGKPYEFILERGG